MDSIDSRVIAKAKAVRDDEVTVIDIVRAIGKRLTLDESTALQRLIEVIVSNPTLDFYDRVATLDPFLHIRKQVISNAEMEIRLRLTVRSGWDAVEEYFPHDTCRLDKVRVAKDAIVSTLDNHLPKWLNEIKWITKPTKRVGSPPKKGLKDTLDKAHKYAKEYYGNIQNNPISCNELIRNEGFIDAVFPKKEFLEIKLKDKDLYKQYYGIPPRSIVNKITPLKENAINRIRKSKK